MLTYIFEFGGDLKGSEHCLDGETSPVTRPSRLSSRHNGGRCCGPHVQTIWLQHCEDGEASPVTRPGRLRFRLIGGRCRGLHRKSKCKCRFERCEAPCEKYCCLVCVW